MASFLLYPDGRVESVQPGNGKHWTVEELQTLVGGYIEIVRSRDGSFIVLDEEGKLHDPKPVNLTATLMRGMLSDPIVGVVLICDNKYELDGPDDAELEAENERADIEYERAHADDHEDDE